MEKHQKIYRGENTGYQWENKKISFLGILFILDAIKLHGTSKKNGACVFWGEVWLSLKVLHF